MQYRIDVAVVGVHADERRLRRIADALRVAQFGAVRAKVVGSEGDAAETLALSRIVLFVLSEAACESEKMRDVVRQFQPTERLEEGHLSIPVLLESVTRMPAHVEDRRPIDLTGRIEGEGALAGIADEIRDLAQQIAEGRGQIPIPTRLAFAAMPFGDGGLDEIYLQCVKQPLESLGFACRRGDDPQGGEPIVEQVKELIDKSQLVIAQLSGSNPNVLWEIGYAQARELPLILIQQDPWPRDASMRRRAADGRACFMVRHLRLEMYTDDEAGRIALRTLITEQVKVVYGL